MARAHRRLIRLPGVNVRATLTPFGVFRSDPTHRWWTNGFARAVLTPAGPGTISLEWGRDGDVTAETWGAGAAWLLDAAPRLVGEHDDPSGFDPGSDRRLVDLWRRHGNFRLGASGVVWQEMAVTILGQRVTTQDAMRTWRRITMRWGQPAPGPHDLRLPVEPSVLAGRSSYELHRDGLERRRADTLVAAARRTDRLEEAATMELDDALRRLSALPGLGPWTATVTATLSHADPDLVILGDYGVPTLVSYALTGSSERVDDERMLELLEPFAGHRWRLVRLIHNLGISAPRRGPRATNPRIAEL